MPTPPQPTWQTTLNPRLVQRLMLPVTQPGVIGSEFTDQIRARAERWVNRLPLLTTLGQRHLPAEGTYPGQTPIVYAQPLPPDDNATVSKQTSVPTTPMTDQPMVIQAKFAPGALAHRGASMAPEPQPLPDLPRVQPRAVAGFDGLDAGPGVIGGQPPRLNAGWPDLAVQSVESVEPGGEGRFAKRSGTDSARISASEPPQPTLFPLPTPVAEAAIVPPPLGQPLPIVTAPPVGSPSALSAPDLSAPSLPWDAQNLGQAARLPAPLSPMPRRWVQHEQPLAEHPHLSPTQSERVSAAKTAEPRADQPSPLPRVRSLAPKTDWGQPPPLALAPLAVVSPTQSTPAGSLGMANLPPGEAGTLPVASLTGPTTGPESPSTGPSIVRDLSGGAMAAVPAAVQPAQTVVSQAPPPPLDVEALANQVERRLARRMAIERERRGWRP